MSIGNDFGSTTSVIVWIRNRVTPTVLWSAIGALVTALVVSITWLVSTQSDIRNAQNDVHRLQESVSNLEKERIVLNEIKMQTEVMSIKVDTIADEVSRQREWRERIETVAEERPPHVRRR